MQGPKGRSQRPEGPKSRPNAEAGLSSRGGALGLGRALRLGELTALPREMLGTSESDVSSPSRVRGGAGTAQSFFTVLGTAKCLS